MPDRSGKPTRAQKGGKRQGAAAPVVFARNRRARHDYQIEETVEAGLVLHGSEVKAIRSGKVNLTDAFADVQNGEAWLIHADVSGYVFSPGRNHEARRRRGTKGSFTPRAATWDDA